MNFELNSFDRIPDMTAEQNDPAVETLMESMHANPLGRLLEVISLLPEVRTEKVIKARETIEHTDICSDTRMDVALDRILEELVIED